MNQSSSFPPAGSPYRGPMTLGQVLDRTFRLVRANLRLFAGIGIVPAVVSLLFVAAIETAMFLPVFSHFPKPPTPEDMAHLFNPAIIIPLILITTVINGVVLAIYLAAATYAATQADRGLAVSISEAWQQARSRAGRAIWLLFLIYVIAFLPAIVIELLCFGGFAMLTLGHSNPNPAVYFLLPLGMLLFFAAIVYGILIALRFSLAFPACVVEGLPARAALKRSGHLSRGAKGRVFVVFLVIYAACYAFILLLFAVLGLLSLVCFLAGMALGIHLDSPLGYAAIAFLGICAALGFLLYIALSWAGFSTALAVIYHDQRLRKEGPPLAPPQVGALA
ncbi:MAG: hypothetical protein WBQ94_06725 [Terracidiphilus sp.]